MRRLALLALALATISSLLISGSMFATAASRPVRTPALPANQIEHGIVGPGGTWTLYYESWDRSEVFCAVLLFGSGSVFTDSKGGGGTWSGNVALKYTATGDLNSGDTFKGKFQHSGAYNGDYVGSVIDATRTGTGTPFSPFFLEPGKDPMGEGNCSTPPPT